MRRSLLIIFLALTACTSQPQPEAAPPPAPTPSPVVTTEPAPSPTPEPLPLEGLHVLLDPGHNTDNALHPQIINAPVPDGRGGTKACNTAGTVNLNGYPEHEFNMAVAASAKKILEERGARVSLTRTTGVGPCVDERGAMAGEIGADILVSIHGNGSASPEVAGFFAMTAATPPNEAQGQPSFDLAQDIIASLAEKDFTPTTIMSPLMIRDDLATINHSTVPATVLELAEFRNPVESAAVEDPATQERYGLAVADGITTWWLDR